MVDLSPLGRIKSLETQLRAVLSKLDLYELPVDERKVVKALKSDLTDVRLDIRDYEFADTLAEQTRHGKQARKRLERVRKAILTASEYNIFSAIDVALYTAQLEQIVDEIK